MKKPILTVMAAGLGSRYGGLKQIAPVDKNGQILIDYSIYDAYRAGFETVVCIIKPEMRTEFHEVIGKRLEKHMEVRYAFQRLDMLPQGWELPAGRTKPWGTAQAVLCAKDVLDAPFAVINADDFYGREAFEKIYRFLTADVGDNRYAMVGYEILKTLTDYGSVARGVCEVENGVLREIHERTNISLKNGAPVYTENNMDTQISKAALASMNLWGFPTAFLNELEKAFPVFLAQQLPENPLKGEFFLPEVVNRLVSAKKAEVEVLRTGETWYGVTYAQDMPKVQEAIQKMYEAGTYPEKLLR